MDAVVPGGAGVAVPTTAGATAARGDPTLAPSAPVGDNTAFARAAADVTEVERAPRLVSQPSALDMRALYPEAARREGLEGDVRLELLVAESGAVRDVRLVERAGNGFDAVALELARRMRFEPATRGGRPVAVWYPWTWKFRLDG
jgi:protein TonB